MTASPFRSLPSVTQILQTEVAGALLGDHPRDRVVVAVRAELDVLRERLGRGESIDGELTPVAIAARAAARVKSEDRPRFRPVINATGIVLHTNLGRAPLADAAATAAHQ